MTNYIIDVVFCIIYGIIDLKLYSGLKQLKIGKAKHTSKVSVLVCARNEENQIERCIQSILKSDYNNFEILVANDRSTDSTLQILLKLQSEYPQKVKILDIQPSENPENWSPKKYAINELIKMSDAEFILLTDADCIVPSTWVTAMTSEFEEGIDFVVGHSIYEKCSGMNHQFFGLQALDFLSHMIVACGAVVKKFPITSTGTSLAYRRAWFQKVGGFVGVAEVPSGDDDLLLHKISNENPRAIRFCASKNGSVTTFPAPTVRSLWEQRKRWASKTILYTPRVVALLLFVFLFYSYIFIGFATSLLRLNLTGILLFGFLAFWKTSFDYLVMKRGAKLFNRSEFMSFFPLTSALHIPMIFFSVLFGIFSKFDWKK